MIIATAGHIDHGKTMLVKSLTGIDTDKLPEEKARGISIDLGFAFYNCENGNILGFVDVPGHERFIRNMISGVSNIDFALIVIAADDGVMPQTKEHLEILSFLGVKRGAVVITKIDRVNSVRLEEMRNESKKLISGTQLSESLIFEVSNINKKGVEELRSHLQIAATASVIRKVNGNFRLSIDRYFSLKGSGLIVAGSVYSGTVSVGDQLLLSPLGNSVRVRAIHSQSVKSIRGVTGQRCALNISGPKIGKKNISRGDWVLGARAYTPTSRLDANLCISNNEVEPFNHWTSAHLYLGAGNVTCRVAVLENRQIIPGSEGLVQLVLDKPVCAAFGDYFILRDRSAKKTIGGGRIIDPLAEAKGRARQCRVQQLRAVSSESNKIALEALLKISIAGVDLAKFSRARNLTITESENLFNELRMKKVFHDLNQWGFSLQNWNLVLEKLADEVCILQKETKEGLGIPINKAHLALGLNFPSWVFRDALSESVKFKKLILMGGQLFHPKHPPKLNKNDQLLWKQIENSLARNKYSPPIVHDVGKYTGIEIKSLEALFVRLCDFGLLIRVTKNRYFLQTSIKELANIVQKVALEDKDGEIDINKFRGQSSIGRNVAVEVLEFFDRVGLTKRGIKGRSIIRATAELPIFENIL